jgi:glutathione S-transferase
MITVHHLEDSRSQRLLWLLEELGLAYQVKRYARDRKTQLAPKELFAVHSLGKSPVLDDDGLVLAESGAIIEYLLARYDLEQRFRPADALSQAGRDYTYWLHFAEGSLMPYLVMVKVFATVKAAPMPFFVRPIAKQIAKRVEDSFLMPSINRYFDFIEAHLGRQDWFAGDSFSAADVQMSFPLEAAMAGRVAGDYPHIRAFVKRIHGRDAYQRALTKGGDYSYA